MSCRNRKHELLLLLAIVGLIMLVGGSNRAFFGLDNLSDLLRNSIVIGILSLGVLIVLISGGIDVSFAAIAIFSAYATTRLLLAFGVTESLTWALLIAGSIGCLLGSINAFFVAWFRLPTLIVTLGTMGLFRGFMLTFLGSEYITALPTGLVAFSKMDLIAGLTSAGSAYRLPAAFLVLPILGIAISLFLNRTYWGRGVFGLGGDPESAQRAGFLTANLQTFIYCLVGVLSGWAGIIHVSLSRMANPFDLVGMELNVIAAVVLGGARITGGYGSVLGTLMGVTLIVVINNSLILLGVPSYWQKVVVGILILVGAGTTVIRSPRSRGVFSWSE